jgi:hypothetical protein
MSQTANQPVYQFIKGLGYLPIEEFELERFVPELGIALDLACMQLAEQIKCPHETHFPVNQQKGNCVKENEVEHWKGFFKQKAKEKLK